MHRWPLRDNYSSGWPHTHAAPIGLGGLLKKKKKVSHEVERGWKIGIGSGRRRCEFYQNVL